MFFLKSYSKDNLLLKVHKKQNNEKKHKIESIFSLYYGLYDKLKINKSKTLKILYFDSYKNKLEIKNCIVKKSISWIKANFPNVDLFYTISITKKIPIGSGLGGGASNAATVIKYILEKNKIKLSYKNLCDIALNLGSDIPFFLSGYKFALVKNYGDDIIPLNKIFVKYAIYPINVSSLSEKVYEAFDNSSKQYSFDFDKSFYEIMTNNISSVTCYNNLQESIFKLYPDIKKHYMELNAFKNYKIMVNGAGSYLVILKKHIK